MRLHFFVDVVALVCVPCPAHARCTPSFGEEKPWVPRCWVRIDIFYGCSKGKVFIALAKVRDRDRRMTAGHLF